MSIVGKIKLNRNKNGFGSADSWQVITNPWPTSGPYCKTRLRAVVTWVLQTILGPRIFYQLARPLRAFRYGLDYFLHRDRLMKEWTQNSSFCLLDASLYAYVNKKYGGTIFGYRTHGLSPVNTARLIRAFEELPAIAKENLNRVLRQEGAKTQIA